MYSFNYFGEARQAEPIASFQNGKVYYGAGSSVIGTYDSNGNVFRQDGCLIGRVTDEDVYMDRYYRYTQWLDLLSSHGGDFIKFVEEIKTIHQNCLPYTQMWAAKLYGGWVEDRVDTDKIDYYGDSADPIGSGAAFLIVVEDRLVDDRRSGFYMNLENEFYYRLKIKKETNNSDIIKYLKHFEELYGGYPGTGNCG